MLDASTQEMRRERALTSHPGRFVSLAGTDVPLEPVWGRTGAPTGPHKGGRGFPFGVAPTPGWKVKEEIEHVSVLNIGKP